MLDRLSDFMLQSRSWALGFCLLALLLLVGCETETNPVEVTRSFMIAIETLNITQAQTLVCQTQRARVRESLAPFGDISELGEAFNINFAELNFEEQSNDGSTAVVHVSGKMTLSFLGQQETQEINEDHIVIKEEGKWLVCDP